MSLSKKQKEGAEKLAVGVYKLPLRREPHIRVIQTGSNSWVCKLCYQMEDGANFTAPINKEVASVLVSSGLIKLVT